MASNYCCTSFALWKTYGNSSFTKNFYIVLKFFKIRSYFYIQIKNNDAKECKNILNGIANTNVFCNGK